MHKNRIHTKKYLKDYRKNLRESLTPAEAFLWTRIKAKKFKGKRFTRQHSIDNYIVDFYCASEKIVIELDGEVHNNPKAEAYDKRRTVHIESLGYKVIRFENRLVFENLTSVFAEIESHFKT